MSDTDSSPSAVAVEWMVGVLLAGNLVWTTLCLGGYRPETMAWSWLITAAALVIHLLALAFSPRSLHPASWLPVPFLAYAAVNAAFVSPVPWLAWRDWLGWAQMGAVFWLVLNATRQPAVRRFVLGTVLVLAIAAVLLAAYQRFLWPDWLMLGRTQVPQFIGRASGPFGIPNSLAAFLLLLIPACLALTLQTGAGAFQRILFGYCALALLLGLGLTISRGAWLSLAAAVIVWPLSVREKKWEWRMSVALGAFALACVLGVGTYAASPRVKARFDTLVRDAGEQSRPILWRGAAQLFAESPWLGTGAGSFNPLFERRRPAGFNDNPQWAHNDYLNTASDYGVAGFALLFGGIGAVAWRCIRNPGTPGGVGEGRFGFSAPSVTRGMAIGLFAFGLSLLVDFHLKIPALAMLVAVFGGECVLRTWGPPAPRGNSTPLRPLSLCAAAFGIVLVALALALPTYRGEAARYGAREKIDRLATSRELTTNAQKSVLDQAQAALIDACVLDPRNGQAWADRAYVLALWARLAPSRSVQLGRESEQAARTALELSQVEAEFWIRLGVALDLQGRWAQGSEAFGRAVQLAPANVTIWYYYAYHLSLVPASRPLARAAVETALRLDPGYRPAMILQEDLSSAR